jgi:GNAT superfamily N-acetyltransferase
MGAMSSQKNPDYVIVQHQRDEYTISTDPSKLDQDLIQDFLCNHAYWALGRTKEAVQKSIDHSLCFGVYLGKKQIGFARVVTDYTTITWICDVFIIESHRRQGLGKWLLSCVIEHSEIKHVCRFMLATRDAHDLYQNYADFQPLTKPERWMERFPNYSP